MVSIATTAKQHAAAHVSKSRPAARKPLATSLPSPVSMEEVPKLSLGPFTEAPEGLNIVSLSSSSSTQQQQQTIGNT